VGVQVQELVALSQIGEKGRGREEVVVMMRRRDAHGRGEGQQPPTRHKGDIKAAAVHSE